MYLHIGTNRNVRMQEIVGIFDLDTASVSHITKKYLKEREKAGLTDLTADQIPKSFLLTKDGRICFSQLSTATLMGRINGSLNEND